MCGITGFVEPRASTSLAMTKVVHDMARQLEHRGPDGEGAWVDAEVGVALAHRRLAIIDLSSAGYQPMLSACGRYCIVFNGEIYNHIALRKELPDTEQWRGHSDTETLLSTIVAWGLERALTKATGMFALALWDRKERKLMLARDRIGEKPLYYGFSSGTLLFASELKALRAYPGFKGAVDKTALTLLLRYGAISAPYSIYQGIFKLPPGTLLELSSADIANARLPVPSAYWSLSAVLQAGQKTPFTGSEAEAVNELEILLRQSISGQMLADVPLGAFLSGGIDSSTVVALMQAQSARPVKTFTIGFHEGGYDEANHARAVASHLGTEHTELYVTPEQALAVISRLPRIYDEPFADASHIPTLMVAELAKRSVSVCLSGDGGDELFGGYNRYVAGARLWRQLGWVPRGLRACLAEGIGLVSPSAWDSCFEAFGSVLPRSWKVKTPGAKLQKFSEMLIANSSYEVYRRLTSQWTHAEQIVVGHNTSANLLQDQWFALLMPELEHQMMFMDLLSYLPDDILVKVDRAAMGVSLETRVPMLDHHVVEFAWRLPLGMKIRGSKGKWLLREVLDRYVPRALIERPKTGFSTPLASWLRGPLKDWAEDLLDKRKLKDQGYLEPVPIRQRWEEHLAGKRDWSSQLYCVLMFQSWLHEHHRD
jgi:asparagine synthase (glutamine-hydrolysing)